VKLKQCSCCSHRCFSHKNAGDGEDWRRSCFQQPGRPTARASQQHDAASGFCAAPFPLLVQTADAATLLRSLHCQCDACGRFLLRRTQVAQFGSLRRRALVRGKGLRLWGCLSLVWRIQSKPRPTLGARRGGGSGQEEVGIRGHCRGGGRAPPTGTELEVPWMNLGLPPWPASRDADQVPRLEVLNGPWIAVPWIVAIVLLTPTRATST